MFICCSSAPRYGDNGECFGGPHAMGPGNEDPLVDRARGGFCAHDRQRVGSHEQRLQEQQARLVRSCFRFSREDGAPLISRRPLQAQQEAPVRASSHAMGAVTSCRAAIARVRGLPGPRRLAPFVAWLGRLIGPDRRQCLFSSRSAAGFGRCETRTITPTVGAQPDDLLIGTHAIQSVAGCGARGRLRHSAAAVRHWITALSQRACASSAAGD